MSKEETKEENQETQTATQPEEKEASVGVFSEKDQEEEEKDFLKQKIADQEIDGYIETVGRRKTSTARVRIFTTGKGFVVNDKKMEEYFPTDELQKIASDVFVKLKAGNKFSVSVVVSGGGLHSQAEAVRHGLARTLVKLVPESRLELKKIGFLKRDPRTKERRKFGLKKARKSAQWSKR